MAIARTNKNEETTENVVEETKVNKKPARKQMDLSQQVPVINMTQASLSYTAKKGNGYLELDNYLDTDYMTVEDLQIMKNTARGMFKKGWLFIDDEETVEFLGLQNEMNTILKEDELNEFFQLDTETIKEKLETYSSSMKENIYHTLKVKFANNEISNIRTIKAIEKSLGIDEGLSVVNLLEA